MATLRSSTRTTPRRRYTVDAFDGISELQSDISTDDEEDTHDILESDQNDDDLFHNGHEPASEADDDSMSAVDEPDALASDAGERELDDDISIVEDFEPQTKHRTKRSINADAEGQRVYVRGIPDDQSTSIKSSARQLYLYGSADDEFRPVQHAYARWKHEPCLPSRLATDEGLGGYAYNQSFVDEVDKAAVNWAWYVNGGREALQQSQICKSLPEETARSYRPVDGTGERSFVMGPLSNQRFFRTQVGQSIALSDPFQSATRASNDATQLLPSYKSGFVINLGARVNCIDWIPNQSGPQQYLTLSLLPKGNTDACGSTNAFTAHPIAKTSVQIWEFRARQDNHIDKTKQPRLSMVLCAEMGHVKEMKWCPVPWKQPDQLGLLACVTADGALRVFDVARPSSDDATTFVLIEKPAFVATPPNTICTSLTWLSSSRIAASCTNGFIGIWDLTKSFNTSNPRPQQYLGLNTSYITSVVSGYPSFPHMLMTNSMTGHLTLTDLNRPKAASPMGTALSPRSRLCQLSVVWHDFSLMAMSCEDNLSIRAHPLRRWFGALGTNRLKSQAASMAVSSCHPFVLVGTAGGEVVSHNPMGRIVHGLRTELLLQPWFLHEWRRPTEDEIKASEDTTHVRNAERSENDILKSIIGKGGLTRIAEGLKAYHTTLAVKDGNAPNFRNGVQFNTIYEERTAVTSVAWNPNLHVGGWAAAGMADGLLRVEDIAL